MSTKIQRNLSLREAYSVAHALDFISRIGIGQLDNLSNLARMDDALALKDGKLVPASQEDWATLESITDHVSRLMDYPRGGSYGIGHTYVSPNAHRAWEIKKAIDLAIAMNRDASPSFRTVDYDGLMLRYTNDPAPEAHITGEKDRESLTLTLTAEQLFVVNKALDLVMGLYSGDYQAITRLAEDQFLIPFDAKDQFGRSTYEGRPKPNEAQLSALKECMSAYSSIMGFKSVVDLNDYDLPTRLQATVSAQSKIKDTRKSKAKD